MAELTRVAINEPTPGEMEPPTEPEAEQAAPQEPANIQGESELGEEQPHLADSSEEETPDPEKGGLEITPEEEPDRPEWLPEKFKSVEDMAKAYSELEKKISSGDTSEDSDSDSTPDNASQEIIQEASVQYFETGSLTDDTYESLAKAGLSRELVDSYVAGQSALMENQETAIRGVAGNDYDNMTSWAGKNLNNEEMETFNNAVSAGSLDQAKFAVSGLHARYKAANGSQPSLTMGNTTGTGSMPFQDMQEVRRAMSDPRYKNNDKAYHAEVDRRLAVSNI